MPLLRYLLLLFSGLLLSFHWLAAQNTLPASCGTDHLHQQHLLNTPGYATRQQNIDNDILNRTLNPNNQARSGSVLTVPTVVHVMHYVRDSIQGQGTYLADSTVQQAIQWLNDGFRNRPLYDSTRGVDTEIEFCLARQDTNGLYTTGIIHHETDRYTGLWFSDDYWMKTEYAWNTHLYFNIYIVDYAAGHPAGPVSGYSSFPSSHGMVTDGNVVSDFAVDNPVVATLFMHEAGHYLNLYHTFQGGCTNVNCLTDGDRVCDTPPDGSQSYPDSCTQIINTCQTDTVDISANNPFRSTALGGLGDQNDPIHNYMDYTRYDCRKEFSDGQKNRMQLCLTGVRSSLLSSPGCNVVCATPPQAAFTLSADSVEAGTPILITNQSQNATQYSWYLNGQLTSTLANPALTLNTQGMYLVRLVVANGDSLCGTSETTQWIEVTCPVASRIANMPLDGYLPGDTVFFTQNSSSATDYYWHLNGVLMDSGGSWTLPVHQVGMQEIELFSSNGICTVSSGPELLSAGDCNLHQNDQWNYSTGFALDFTGATPVSTQTSAINSSRGTASLSDRDGNLLFYSDGGTVWNRNHQPMPNGTGLQGLSQDQQTLAAIPMPGHPDKAWLFTCRSTAAHALMYHVIDLTADSGRGDVILKNQLIGNWSQCRMLTTAMHANGCDYWLVTRPLPGNNFVCYRLTPDGIQPPVSSPMNPGISYIGPIQVAPDGSRISAGNFGGYSVLLGDFDNATGMVSNTGILPTHQYPSGIAFSPNSDLLYVTGGTGSIFQFDLNAGTLTDIQNSRTDIANAGTSFRGMALAPNGQILVKQWQRQYLGAITRPNQKGFACALDTTGIAQGSASTAFGLHNGPPLFTHRTAAPIYGPATVCANGQLPITYRLSCADSTIWTYQGSGVITNPTAQTVDIQFGSTGMETLTARSWSACGAELVDTLLIQVVGNMNYALRTDTAMCAGDSLVINAGSMLSYFWPDSSNGSTYVAESPETVIFSGISNSGCAVSDTVQITVFSPPPPQPDLGNDTIICGTLPYITFNPLPFAAGYLWSTGVSYPVLTVLAPDTVWVTVWDVCGQSGSDTVIVSVPASPVFQFPGDTTVCPGDSILLTGPVAMGSYTWQDGPGPSQRWADTQGLWWLETDNGCGQNHRDSILLSWPASPTVQLGSDSTLCDGDSLLLSASSGYLSYLWNNGDTTPSIYATQPGNWWVTVTDDCNLTASDSLVVTYFPLPRIDLGSDTVLCPGEGLLLDAGSGFTGYQWGDSSTAQTLLAQSVGDYWVTVTDDCGFATSDSLRILPDAPQAVNLGPDTTICPGDTLELFATAGFSSFTWSDGSSGNSLLVTQPGNYWVEALSINGCSYADTVEVGLCTVSSDPRVEGSIQVYPNPARSACWIISGGNGKVEWHLFNAVGQQVGVSGHFSSPGRQRINLEGLAAGTYSLRVQTAGRIIRWNLVVLP